jgi:hypothetical protein
MVRNTITRLHNTKGVARWRHVPKEHDTVGGMNVISQFKFRLRKLHSEDRGDGRISRDRSIDVSGK